MSYEDYIERFWQEVRELGLDSTQIALGLALLHEWRGAGFPSRCSIPNEVLCNLLSCSKQTLVRARKRLIDGGMIACEEGNARKQPVYVFGVVAVVPGAKEVVREVREPVQKQKVAGKAKPKRMVKAVNGEMSLFREQDMAPKRRAGKVQEPPTLDEVLVLCSGKGMTAQEAKEFYDYYNAQGWLTSSGVRIKNVDSMVNRWLTIQKKRDESDRRFIQPKQSIADNIREAQQYAFDEMQRFVQREEEESGGAVLEGLPDFK